MIKSIKKLDIKELWKCECGTTYNEAAAEKINLTNNSYSLGCPDCKNTGHYIILEINGIRFIQEDFVKLQK